MAVLDVIYNKQLTATQCDSNQYDEDDDKENCISTDENDSELEYIDQDMDVQITDDFSTSNNITIGVSLKMVRNIVKFFKRSPVKNTILQEHVMQQHGKELNLYLDCKTRWNSIETMLERFLKIVDSIRHALQDLNSNLLNENNLHVLNDLLVALKPIKLAIEALGRQDANLLTADAILKFMIESLQQNDNAISKELSDALLIRINERRNKDLVSLMK